jgi:hypothetical protein
MFEDDEGRLVGAKPEGEILKVGVREVNDVFYLPCVAYALH